MPDQRLNYQITTSSDLHGSDQAEAALHKLQSAADDFIGSIKAGVGIDIGSRIVESIAALPERFRAAVDEGVRFNATLESAQLSIASLIRQFEPSKFGSVQAALGKSKETVEALKAAAAESPASFSSLLEGLRSLSGAAFAANIPLEKQIPLTVTLANAVKALGIADNQVAQEAKALLTGDIDMNAQLARTLGITKQEIETNKERGKLYEFLTQRLSSFAEAGKLAGQTFDGLKSNLGDTLDNIRAEASEPIFDALKEGMKSLREELEKPGVKEALKEVGYEVAEIVKGGSALLNFAVRNADSLLTLGKAATFAGVAFASIKLKDLIEALGVKTLRLVGLVPPLAAATEGTVALAVAEDKETASAIRAAEAESKLASARTAAGAAGKAGASVPTPASGGGFRTGFDGGNRIAGAASLGLVIGEAVALYIEHETAALNKETDAVEKAGQAFTDFGTKRASAIKDGKTFDDSDSKGLKATVQEIVDAQIQVAAMEAKVTETQNLYNSIGQITGQVIAPNLAKLTEEERKRYDLLQQDIFARQKDLALVKEITTQQRGAGPGQQQSLTIAQISALDEALAKARENQIKSLAPTAQIQEYGNALADALRAFREQALAAGADAIQVAKVRDVNSLLKFAGDNAGLKGQEIAVKAYDKIYELQTKIKEAAEAAGKAQTDGAQNLAKVLADQKAAVSEGADLTRQKYEIEKQIADLQTQKGLVQSGTDDKSRAEAADQRAGFEKQIYALQDKQREIGNAINANEGRKKADAEALTGEYQKQNEALRTQSALHKQNAQDIEAKIKLTKQQTPGVDTSDLETQAKRERLRQKYPGASEAQIERLLNPQATPQVTETVDRDRTIRYTGAPTKPSAGNPDAAGYTTPASIADLDFDASGKLVSRAATRAAAEQTAATMAKLAEIGKFIEPSEPGSPLRRDGDPNAPAPIAVPPANFTGLAKPQEDAAEATKRTAEELDRSGSALKEAAERQQKAVEDNLPKTADATKAAADAADTNLPQIAEGTAKVTEALTAINFAEKFKSIEDTIGRLGDQLDTAVNSLNGRIAQVGSSVMRTAAPSGAEWDSWTGSG